MLVGVGVGVGVDDAVGLTVGVGLGLVVAVEVGVGDGDAVDLATTQLVLPFDVVLVQLVGSAIVPPGLALKPNVVLLPAAKLPFQEAFCAPTEFVVEVFTPFHKSSTWTAHGNVTCHDEIALAPELVTVTSTVRPVPQSLVVTTFKVMLAALGWGVGEPVGDGDWVAVGAAVGEPVSVGDAVGAAVGVGVGIAVGVAVGVGVGVGVAVGVRVGDGDGDGVEVAVGVGDGVGVGAPVVMVQVYPKTVQVVGTRAPAALLVATKPKL